MKIETDYGYCTHIPLIQTLLITYFPEFVLELGIGDYSTPLFLQANLKYVGIENNFEWYRHFNFLDTIRFQEVPFDNAIRWRNLSKAQKLFIISMYKELYQENFNYKMKLLMVDNYTCCRATAINILYSKFNIIIYHDCEPNGIPWYNYYFAKDLLNNYKQLTLRTENSSWSGCFIKKEIFKEDLIFSNSINFIQQYEQEYKIKNITLIKEN